LVLEKVMSKKKKVLDRVILVKELSRERVPSPKTKVIPDKRRKAEEDRAKGIARFNEE
jgi:hypothetical protein